MNKKIISLFLIISILVISGCTKVEETPKPSDVVMTTAFEYWPGQYWIDIAMDKGWFKEAGLNVEYTFDANDDFVGSEEALANGELVLHQLVLFDLMRFISEGKDLVVVMNADVSNGGDQIVAREGISTIADLEGKKVGVDQGSFLEFMLNTALERDGLSLSDIIIVQAQAEDTHMLINGEIDALLTWGPHAIVAKKGINGKTIFDTSEISGLVTDVLTFHRSFIEEHPENVQAYVNVWHKTRKYMQANEDEAFSIIAKKYDVSLEDVKGFAESDKILTLVENKIVFSYAAGFESLHGTAKQINDFMNENGITDMTLDSIEFIDNQFIRAVQD